MARNLKSQKTDARIEKLIEENRSLIQDRTDAEVDAENLRREVHSLRAAANARADALTAAQAEVRILRVVEYVGQRAWVEDTVSRAIHGTMRTPFGRITAFTLTEFADKLELARKAEARTDTAAKD